MNGLTGRYATADVAAAEPVLQHRCLEPLPLALLAGGRDANTLSAVKLAQTILYVQDVEQAAAFYEHVFELERGEVNPEGVFIALKTGETTLAFVDAAWVAGNGIDFAPVRPQAQPPGIEISFWVEDVEATQRAAIETGASGWYRPMAKRWGQTVSRVREPNGFIVEISSPPSTRDSVRICCRPPDFFSIKCRAARVLAPLLAAPQQLVSWAARSIDRDGWAARIGHETRCV